MSMIRDKVEDFPVDFLFGKVKQGLEDGLLESFVSDLARENHSKFLGCYGFVIAGFLVKAEGDIESGFSKGFCFSWWESDLVITKLFRWSAALDVY